ncbi:unnamed protein product [Lathyrus oleraceus]|uniref:Uncharacterized protein n=1 Tax=Pisum sativum TaxID=3888 RepID=A0A9D5AYR3_PEA|nr:hypothetical protein KIW84_046470 [Pisum sativum]
MGATTITVQISVIHQVPHGKPFHLDFVASNHALLISISTERGKQQSQLLIPQARDAYYKGEPLIVDDMFDRVELKLKWYGSKSVVKYP